MTPKIAPYGSWKSPISADDAFSQFIGLGGIQVDGESVYWAEDRPDGHTVIVRKPPQGPDEDITPPGYDVRTRVHEYGGGDYLVSDGVIYFSNFNDQKIYRQLPGADPQPFTHAEGMRYADAVMDERHGRLIAVGEDHTHPNAQAVNTLVSIRIVDGEEQILVSGNDFYSSPRLNPAANKLAWLTWKHPNMPWDGTELWVADILPDGSPGQQIVVAGGEAESIFQPEWSPDGSLYFISDRTGWWNLYRWHADSVNVEALHPMEAEFGKPQWVFGMSTYGFASAEKLICTYSQNGQHHLATLDMRNLKLERIPTPYSYIDDVQVSDGQVLFIAASATEPTYLVQYNLTDGELTVLKQSRVVKVDREYFSIGQPIEFPTEQGLTAYGFYYPPKNRDYTGPTDELPPLLVMSHGGPTSATSLIFRYGIQYWTTRGFAVLDVNYGGSTGFGRLYRERLKGQWGIVDVADCVNGARYLVSQGMVDANRLAITGGSAGGYATLCAVTFYQQFKAGASYYGISDLEAMARDTHKFESRYLDRLIGPYPARRDLYIARSPIHHIAQITCPLILLQGLDDPVVPPNQSRMIYEALLKRDMPVAYLTFPGEQHGFVKAENNIRALEAELYFYARIFKFDLADEVAAVKIENL